MSETASQVAIEMPIQAAEQPRHGLLKRVMAAGAVVASSFGIGGGEVRAGADDSIPPSGKVCFDVEGNPGDAALVNLTPVLANAPGNGQLISSDVKNPPVASNVNFGPGTVDPNVAIAPIGKNGEVCYQNSAHASVHLVADHLGTISGDAFTPATPSGAPDRKVDTRAEDKPDIGVEIISQSGSNPIQKEQIVADCGYITVSPGNYARHHRIHYFELPYGSGETIETRLKPENSPTELVVGVSQTEPSGRAIGYDVINMDGNETNAFQMTFDRVRVIRKIGAGVTSETIFRVHADCIPGQLK